MSIPASSQAKSVDRQYRVLLWLAAMGFFMQALDATIVNTALPNIAHSLHTNPLQMHNVLIAYVLTVAVLIPISGWMADRFGIRNIYLLSITIFSLASLGCALSQTYPQLITGRVFQGIGGAFLLPVARLALLRILPREQFLSALSFIAIPGLVGPLVGPVLGGILVEFTSWHWIFLINLPIGILGFVLTCRYMPNLIRQNLPQFDFIGFILLTLIMVGFTLCLEGFSQGNWTTSHILMVFMLSILSTYTYIHYAKRHAKAIFRPSLFAERSFRIGIIGNFISRLGSSSLPFLLPLMLQLIFAFSPIQTGWMMVPLILGSLMVKKIATRVIRQFGYNQVLFTNTILLGLGIISFAFFDLHHNITTQTIHLFLFGCINSTQFTAMNSFTLKDLSPSETANGNSLLSMVVNLCISLGVALVSLLFHVFHLFNPTMTSRTSFQFCFVALGIITLLASMIFKRADTE